MNWRVAAAGCLALALVFGANGLAQACRCDEVPPWPVDLKPDQAWVESAIRWRLSGPTAHCTDVVAAVDALVLRWIAEAPDWRIRIERNDWSFLEAHPEGIYLVVQAVALRVFEKRPVEPREVIREVRRAGRGCWKMHSPEMRRAFRAARQGYARGSVIQR